MLGPHQTGKQRFIAGCGGLHLESRSIGPALLKGSRQHGRTAGALHSDLADLLLAVLLDQGVLDRYQGGAGGGGLGLLGGQCLTHPLYAAQQVGVADPLSLGGVQPVRPPSLARR